MRKMMAGLLALVLLVVGGLAFQGDTSAASLTTYVRVQVAPTLTATVGMATNRAEMNGVTEFTLANGTGASQGDVVYSSTATILTGATLSLDLAGGGLTDAFGTAFGPAKVRAIYIRSRAANTTNLTILGNANAVPILNTAATTVTLTPGDVFFNSRLAAAGAAVTAGTGDIVQLVNAAGASAIVDIIIVGTSA
jgi:hypothetical protein